MNEPPSDLNGSRTTGSFKYIEVTQVSSCSIKTKPTQKHNFQTKLKVYEAKTKSVSILAEQMHHSEPIIAGKAAGLVSVSKVFCERVVFHLICGFIPLKTFVHIFFEKNMCIHAWKHLYIYIYTYPAISWISPGMGLSYWKHIIERSHKFDFWNPKKTVFCNVFAIKLRPGGIPVAVGF